MRYVMIALLIAGSSGFSAAEAGDTKRKKARARIAVSTLQNAENVRSQAEKRRKARSARSVVHAQPRIGTPLRRFGQRGAAPQQSKLEGIEISGFGITVRWNPIKNPFPRKKQTDEKPAEEKPADTSKDERSEDEPVGEAGEPKTEEPK